MGVELGVLRAARAMLEAGNHQIAGRLAGHCPAIPHAGCGHVLFDMGEGGFDGLPMGSEQPLVTGNLGHD